MTLDSEAGLRAAYRAHAGELFSVALRGLADRGSAEDAVQETFLRAWRSADRYDPTLGSERTWLFAILRSVVIDTRRRQAVRPAVVGDPGPVDATARVQRRNEDTCRAFTYPLRSYLFPPRVPRDISTSSNTETATGCRA